MSADKVFIDTNVLTYLFDDAEPEKQKQAKACLESQQGAHELVISTQVLQELYVSLTKGNSPITTDEVAERAVRAAAGYTVFQVDAALVFSAISTSRRNKLSFWDALIIQAASAAGCEVVLSEDLNDGQLIEGVRVQSPFA